MSPSINMKKDHLLKAKDCNAESSEQKSNTKMPIIYSAVKCYAGPCAETLCFRPKRLLSLWQLQKSLLPYINLTARTNLP